MSALGLTGAGLRDWIAAHEPELVAIRRRLHAHPELSWEEHATTTLIAERLEQAGLATRVLSRGTGLVCDVGDPPLVALRADIDALAMQDRKDVSYRSQTPGVAHACGHDVHTTVTLGAGLYLAEHWPPAARSGLRLIFQPAEELLPGGALEVIADGGLDGVEVIFGAHCDPKLDLGLVGLRRGPITSAADMALIELVGPGGHTARPERTVDLVALAAQVVSELPDRVRRRLGTEAPLKIVFGALHAGDAPNVIPTTAELRASIRTPVTTIWDALPLAVEAEVRAMAEGAGATCAVHYTRGVPPVLNDADAIEQVREGVQEVLGAHAVTDTIQSWGGDDFAWFTQRLPAAYVRLGTHDPADDGPRLDLHAGLFDVDERVIGIGVQVMVAAVERSLEARR